jgi:hypothetical protein
MSGRYERGIDKAFLNEAKELCKDRLCFVEADVEAEEKCAEL